MSKRPIFVITYPYSLSGEDKLYVIKTIKNRDFDEFPKMFCINVEDVRKGIEMANYAMAYAVQNNDSICISKISENMKPGWCKPYNTGLKLSVLKNDLDKINYFLMKGANSTYVGNYLTGRKKYKIIDNIIMNNPKKINAVISGRNPRLVSNL